MDAATLISPRVLVEDPHQQRRLHRPRAQRVHPHPLARELHRELAAHRKNRALRGRVSNLRGRRAEDRHERRHVDHRPASRLQQVGDAVLATEKDALGIHRLDSIPRVRLGDEDRVVVGRHDARVVVDHIDLPVALCCLLEHRLHALRIADVSGEEERLAALGRRLFPRLAAHVRDASQRDPQWKFCYDILRVVRAWYA